jgi:hypothetical protein
VLGALILVFVLVVVIPVAVLMSGVVVAAGLGWLLKSTADADHAGSELLETNR